MQYVSPDAEIGTRIGNVIVCLNYLCRESRSEGLPEVSQVIENALSRIISWAINQHLDSEDQDEKTVHPAALSAALEDVEIFLDRFCAIEDSATQKSLLNLLQKVEHDPDLRRRLLVHVVDKRETV